MMAMITQSVAFPAHSERREAQASIMRTPPSMQRRPVNLSLIATNSRRLQEVYVAGRAGAEKKKRLIVVVTVIVIERKLLSKRSIRHPANKQNTCGGV